MVDEQLLLCVTALDDPIALGLAQSVLGGDSDAIFVLDDRLQELEGDNMLNVTSLVAGKQYCVQTVTYCYIGVLKEVTLTELIMEKASCVYDTGRFNNFLTNGTIRESVPFNGTPVSVNRGSIVVVHEWAHKLPTEPISDRDA